MRALFSANIHVVPISSDVTCNQAPLSANKVLMMQSTQHRFREHGNALPQPMAGFRFSERDSISGGSGTPGPRRGCAVYRGCNVLPRISELSADASHTSGSVSSALPPDHRLRLYYKQRIPLSEAPCQNSQADSGCCVDPPWLNTTIFE
jgi:hypothetical protein